MAIGLQAARLEATQQEKSQTVAAIKQTDVKQMWRDDLDAFIQALGEHAHADLC